MQQTRLRAPRAACAVLALASLGACDATYDALAPSERSVLSRANASAKAAKVARIVLEQQAVTPPSNTVPAGVPFRVVARLYDAANREITGRQVQWATRAPTIASVDTLGTVTPLAAGQTELGATVDGVTGRLTFSVAAPVAVTGPAVAPTTGTDATTASVGAVALTIRRFDGQSGAVTVSNSIPLRPGTLRAGQEGLVRLTVAGQERRIYARTLVGTNPDGSAQALLVQFPVTLGATETLAGTLQIGTARAAEFTVLSPLASPSGVPAAAALPTDPAYLVATGLVGPTLTASQTSALGGGFAEYERAFRPAADAQWAAAGDAWEHNYYDRALVYAAMWARTGDPEYWVRSVKQAAAYRRNYLEANNYMASPHWAQLEGVATHYWLTGDEASRTAVSRTADVLWIFVYRGNWREWDPRIYGRVLLAQLLAYRLDGAARGDVQLPAAWSQRLDTAVSALVNYSEATGRYVTGPEWCGGQANFMIGVLHDALIQAHTYYRADPRIVAAVRRGVDYQWATQWRADAGAFQYVNLTCGGNTTDPAGDVNGLLVAPFGWLARVTGNAAYRSAGDAVFTVLTRNTWLGGSKQFNQAYALSYRYLGYR